ncbi:MAG TPA: transcriptional regulator [Bacteroidales bacterium]|nr:transcriptional regulator [Bacteroidales bacterium]
MFKDLDPLLHSQLRLSIMSLLLGLQEADFNYLKKNTGATSGNISVQIDKLQQAGYIEVRKTFKGKMPQTICKISAKGVKAFEEYVNTIKCYLEPGEK